MCDRCGIPGSHAFALTERPAHRLAGHMWEGTHAEAAAGAIHPLILEMKAASQRRPGMWRSPIVGLSWNDRPGGFRYFVGIAIDEGEQPADGLVALDLPEMNFASAWHGAGDGDVAGHYGRMMEWIGDEGLKWDLSRFYHREEYPLDYDPAGPPVLRLLMPVAGA